MYPSANDSATQVTTIAARYPDVASACKNVTYVFCDTGGGEAPRSDPGAAWSTEVFERVTSQYYTELVHKEDRRVVEAT